MWRPRCSSRNPWECAFTRGSKRGRPAGVVHVLVRAVSVEHDDQWVLLDRCDEQGIQFYPPFRPRDQNKLRLQDGDKSVVEVPISAILLCGSEQKIFVGEPRRGYVPAEGV